MKKRSKRLKELKTKIQKRDYHPYEAIELLKEVATTNFTETTEAHIDLNLNPKYADQQLRSTVLLPQGTGKSIRIGVVAPTEKQAEAQQAGADVIGGEELMNEIAQGRMDFDVLLATNEMMPSIGKLGLGKVLGPKGLMPSPKAGTVTNDIYKSVNEFKSGKIEYRADRTGTVHLAFGKANFSKEALMENLQAVQESIDRNKPSGAKGRYWETLYISNSMSPSIKVDISTLRNK